MNQASHISTTVGGHFRSWRKRAGVTQDEVALEASRLGVRWTRATVAAIETGRRNVDLHEFLLLPLLATAFPLDQQEDLDASFFLGGYGRLLHAPSPAEREAHELTALALSVYDRANADLQAEAQGQAERHAAQVLGVSPYDVPRLARELWGQSLTDERDSRVVKVTAPDAPARSLQAHRGHVTRELLAEMQKKVEDTRKEWDQHSKRLWGCSWQEQLDALEASGLTPNQAWRKAARQLSGAIDEAESERTRAAEKPKKKGGKR